jgi:hypothetical protein
MLLLRRFHVLLTSLMNLLEQNVICHYSYLWILDSPVGTVVRLDERGIGVQFSKGARDFLISTASKRAVSHSAYSTSAKGFYVGIKRQEREADLSSPSGAEVRNAWSCSSTITYVFVPLCSIKQRDNFTCLLPCVSEMGPLWCALV